MAGQQKLFLLDGMALVYRAHFALIRSPVRTSKGVNTSAMVGFANTLLDLLENHGAGHVAVVFDTSAPTFRHQEYPEYKAQRDEMPEELAAAIPAVKSLARALGVPVIERDGFEADDIIGTLATRAVGDGMDEVFMVTPDKDFGQLVAERIRMWKPGRKGGAAEVLGVPEILEMWGIDSPEQVIDILALMGDASDNIPGVPGVGEKTAKKLIAEHKTLENVIAAAPGIKGKLGERLVEHAEQARLCRRLATIKTDVELDVGPGDLVLGERDPQALAALFAEYEMNNLGRRVLGDAFKAGRGRSAPLPEDDLFANTEGAGGVEGGESTEGGDDALAGLSVALETMDNSPHDYRGLRGEEGAREIVALFSGADAFSFDTETTGLDPRHARLLGIAFSKEHGQAFFLILPDDEPARQRTLDALRPLFGGGALKIAQNLKYDLAVLAGHGVDVMGPCYDTMLAHAICLPDQRHGMDFMAESLLGYSPQPIADLIGPRGPTQKNLEEVLREDPEKVSRYACEDADITLRLWSKLEPMLDESGQRTLFETVEMPLVPILAAMESEGIRLDTDRLSRVGHELGEIAATHRDKVFDLAGSDFNLNSPRQLGEILFGSLKLLEKPKKTRTGQYVTNEQVLLDLAPRHPIVQHVLDYRQATKLKNTYVDALPAHVHPDTGRVHTHFHQLVAATGRLASSDPNLQNIPIRSDMGRRIRDAFVARDEEHVLVCADYSQVELRIMASLSGDAALLDAFAQGKDIHTDTAERLFQTAPGEATPEMRRRAKMVNFGIIYGISAFGLAQRLGIPRGEAASIIESHAEAYPGVTEYIATTIARARELGYAETPAGRRRLLPDLASANQNIRSAAERMAINTPIQGAAADLIKLAMIRVDKALAKTALRARLVLQVHDELVFDCPREEEEALRELVAPAMTQAMPLPGVDFAIEVGSGFSWLEAH